MHSIVIIDDEPVIVRGLRATMPWDRWNCEVIGTAEDGKEGLELIRRDKPDIVITDISMPNMTGLEMIAGMKSEFPDMRVTILTGFRDFDYAREAIRLGVDRFLLKPSKMDELEEAVSYMVSRLENDPSENNVEYSEYDNTEIEEPAASNFTVEHAITYMQEHYSEKLSLSDVADQVFVSKWHLSKLINEIKGVSFSDLLQDIRIEKSKEFMKDPSLRLSDISWNVGFQDSAQFSRVFKKHTGHSPLEYRNKYIGEEP